MTPLQSLRDLPPVLRAIPLALALAFCLSPAAQGATIFVEADCTLDDAIRAANFDIPQGDCPAGSGPDTIVLTYDVVLAEELPDVREETVIDGAGHTVSRDPSAPFPFTIFTNAASGDTVEYRDITITGGNGTFAGGIDSSSNLMLVDSTVSGNSGNGIYASGTATIVRSTISDNSTNGVYTNYSFLDVFDSTISGNAEIGVVVGEYTEVALVNSTVSGNDMGIAEAPFIFYPYVDLTHTTVARNRIGFEIFPQYAGAVNIVNSVFGKNLEANCGGFAYFDATGANFADDGTCGTGFARLNGLSGNLRDWGGPTLTHGLKSHSSAIDAAGTCGLATDQRGFLRDTDACDSGAHERGAQPPAPAGGD